MKLTIFLVIIQVLSTSGEKLTLKHEADGKTLQESYLSIPNIETAKACSKKCFLSVACKGITFQAQTCFLHADLPKDTQIIDSSADAELWIATEPRFGCKGNPCLNNGICYNNNPSGNYTCKCPNGFAGKNCEIDSCSGTFVNKGSFDLTMEYTTPTGENLSVPFGKGASVDVSNAKLGSTLTLKNSWKSRSCVLDWGTCHDGLSGSCGGTFYSFECECL